MLRKIINFAFWTGLFSVGASGVAGAAIYYQTLGDYLYRRGAHAHQGIFQRAAQDAGGTARARDVHLCHHGAAQDSAHHPVTLPAF